MCGEEVPCEPTAQDDAPEGQEVQVAVETNVNDEIEKRIAAKAAWKVRKEAKAAAAAAAAAAGEETGGTRRRALLMVDAQDGGRAVEEAAMLRGAATYATHRKAACEKLADDRCKVSIASPSFCRGAAEGVGAVFRRVARCTHHTGSAERHHAGWSQSSRGDGVCVLCVMCVWL